MKPSKPTIEFVRYTGPGDHGKSRLAEYRCSCGKAFETRVAYVRRGNVVSCGCYRAAVKAYFVQHGRLHGESVHARGGVTKEYTAWVGMKKRCHNPTADQYPNYGGRGIIVCEKWRNSYEAFLLDVGRAPSRRHTIDRINSNGNYEPGNCRWATPVEQSRNRRITRRLEIDGVVLPLTEWAEKTGVSADTIRKRLKHGWEPTMAVFTPVMLATGTEM
jgi:hypothetical protein